MKVQPKSGREGDGDLLQGTGDALLTYENEAIFIEREGEEVEHVTPRPPSGSITRWRC